MRMAKMQTDMVNGFPDAAADALDVGISQGEGGNFVLLRVGKRGPSGEVIEETFHLPMDLAISLGTQIINAGNFLYELEKADAANGGH